MLRRKKAHSVSARYNAIFWFAVFSVNFNDRSAKIAFTDFRKILSPVSVNEERRQHRTNRNEQLKITSGKIFRRKKLYNSIIQRKQKKDFKINSRKYAVKSIVKRIQYNSIENRQNFSDWLRHIKIRHSTLIFGIKLRKSVVLRIVSILYPMQKNPKKERKKHKTNKKFTPEPTGYRDKIPLFFELSPHDIRFCRFFSSCHN